MKTNWRALAGLVLASTLAAGHAQTTAGSTTATTTRKAHHRVVPKRPSVESQIQELRQDMDSQRTQIDSLKQQLTDRDAQLQQAQQAATAAQAAAQQAQQAAQTQQAAIEANNQSVTSLQGAVADLKTSNQAVVETVHTESAKIHADIEHPDVLHYKGITLSPQGSFIEAATVDRTSATASDIPTPFSSIPYPGADAAQISEFYGTGRQSRIALDAEGRVSNGIIRGYYEADWLGTGVTSNNNQSNSYVLRERLLFAQAQLDNGWTFTGGAQWSLVTETRNGLDDRTEILPPTIDPNYNVGFVWERQYGFRATKKIGNSFWLGASVENPQTLAPSCANAGGTAACPKNYLEGAVGTSGGLYNSGGQPGATSSAPITTYSYNLTPDFIGKVAIQPSWGQFEVFGIGRIFRDRIYPNANAGDTAGTAAGAYNDSTVGGGIGGGGRVYVAQKRFEVALHGLWGEGIGRYGATQLPDTTLRPDAQLALLHGFSALGEVVAHPTKRLDLYFDYGADYAGRRVFANGGGFEGYGIPNAVNSGCSTEPLPGNAPTAGFAPSSPANCAGITKDTQEPTVGYWYNIYAGPHGRLRQGFQYSYVERYAWSGAGGIGAEGTDNVIETSLRYYMP
jgi:type II secretory pathway pseudopilin PulG